MSQSTKKTGGAGEDLAAAVLVKKGYRIIERNYRYGKGEIDIIAKDGDVLVFIEVKARKNLEYGPPELAITKGKQQQIKKIASAYLYEKEIKETDCRIDVIAIQFMPKQKPRINHIKNAF
jgi:putative endonuclease